VRFRIARVALRLLLGAYDRIEPSSLAFEYTALRRPVLAPEQGVDIRFNVAHADDLALIAFVRGTDVGVDIERRRSVQDAAALAANYFSLVEALDIAGLTGSAQSDAFLRCWTRKEAVTKATGEGLTRSFGSFTVPLDAAMPSHAVDLTDDLGDQTQLILHTLTPGGQYFGALALGADVTRVQSFTFDLDGALHARRG
jgi:4'-phosphopantetheinyl transferase